MREPVPNRRYDDADLSTGHPPMLKLPALILFASALWPVLAHAAEAKTGPSFDCAKAKGRTEKEICADPALSALDRRAAELFAIAQSQSTDAGGVKRDQRRWLSDRGDCADAPCLRQSYEQRIAALGALTGRFQQSFATAVCQPFSDPDSRSKLLANVLGPEDINNDGEVDRASGCSGGTANLPCVTYSSSDGKPLVIQPDGFEWMTYGAFGRKTFRLENRTFIYYANDAALEQPALISYVTPTNREVRICDFETQVGSAVLEGGDEVCAAIEAADERIEKLQLNPTTIKLANERRDTQVRASGKVDIDNDGFEENVVELNMSSGAGRGCELNYFELVNDEGDALGQNSNADAVRALQGFEADGPTHRNCGVVENRLLRFNDRIYLETNATHSAALPHELRMLQGEAVIDVCTFERQVRTRVKTLY